MDWKLVKSFVNQSYEKYLDGALVTFLRTISKDNLFNKCYFSKQKQILRLKHHCNEKQKYLRESSR